MSRMPESRRFEERILYAAAKAYSDTNSQFAVMCLAGEVAGRPAGSDNAGRRGTLSGGRSLRASLCENSV
jgi:hypothetical protein